MPLGALCWAAAGKDPGYTPLSLLELLSRRGKFQPNQFMRLHLKTPVNLPKLKHDWTEALKKAKQFVSTSPNDETGCLYFDERTKKFVEPSQRHPSIVTHYGKPQGVWPRVLEQSV